MRAFVLTGHGGPEKLVFDPAWPVPEPLHDEVLINVSACALNNTDLATRLGWYKDVALSSESDCSASATVRGWTGKMTFPRIQGADICGQVVAAGAHAGDHLLGRRVLVDPWIRDPEAPLDLERCGYLGSERDGGFADYVAVPVRNVHSIESPLSDSELAAAATSSMTALNMLDRIDVREGELILVTGASGGVGSALLQLAHGSGARPVALSATRKKEALRKLGAVAVIPRHHRNVQAVMRSAVGRPVVDAIVDVVGGEGWPSLLGMLRRGGRYCCAGAIAGPRVQLDLRVLYLKDLTFYGVTVPPPYLFDKLVHALECAWLRPPIAATFPLERLHEAQQMFLAKRHVGKIVIDLRADFSNVVTEHG
jgi:NADPH:quinone reductase-like Zn-dependent oxidoreductase